LGGISLIITSAFWGNYIFSLTEKRDGKSKRLLKPFSQAAKTVLN
jgi:hypothetical protein